MSTPRLPSLLVAAFAVLAGSLPVAASAAAPAASGPLPSQNATFGIQPSARTTTDSRSAFQYSATPGSTLTDYAAVTNYSTQPLTLTVRSADAANTPQGGFALMSEETGKPRDVGAWVDLPAAERTLRLKPRSRAIVAFRVSVPAQASPGDHVGGLQVTLNSAVTSKSGQRLKLVQSVGARMYIRVSGPLHPRLTIRRVHASFGGPLLGSGRGRVNVTYVVSNTGNVALGGISSVHVSGLLGDVEQVNIPRIQLLLPGYSVTMKTSVHGVLPQVFMKVRVRVIPLALPGTAQRLPDHFESTGHFWAVPWLLLIALALLVVAVAGWTRRRRIRRRGAAVPRPRASAVEVRRPVGGRHK